MLPLLMSVLFSGCDVKGLCLLHGTIKFTRALLMISVVPHQKQMPIYITLYLSLEAQGRGGAAAL